MADVITASVTRRTVVVGHASWLTVSTITEEAGCVGLVLNVTHWRVIQALVAESIICASFNLLALVPNTLVSIRTIVIINTTWPTEVGVEVTEGAGSVRVIISVADTIIATAHDMPIAVAGDGVAVSAVYITSKPGRAVSILGTLVIVTHPIVADLITQTHTQE